MRAVSAAFGVDPFQTLMSGLDKLIPIHFGTLYVLTNAVLLLFAFFTDRHYINLGTFINLFLLGYVVEFSHNLLLRFFPEPALPLRLLFMLIAIFMLCISSSFYSRPRRLHLRCDRAGAGKQMACCSV